MEHHKKFIKELLGKSDLTRCDVSQSATSPMDLVISVSLEFRIPSLEMSELSNETMEYLRQNLKKLASIYDTSSGCSQEDGCGIPVEKTE